MYFGFRETVLDSNVFCEISEGRPRTHQQLGETLISCLSDPLSHHLGCKTSQPLLTEWQEYVVSQTKRMINISFECSQWKLAFSLGEAQLSSALPSFETDKKKTLLSVCFLFSVSHAANEYCKTSEISNISARYAEWLTPDDYLSNQSLL